MFIGPLLQHRRKGADGFTLVELLVVIGITALLISILLPALTKVRTQATTTKCLANLRSLGMALQLYGNDHKGVICFARPHTGNATVDNPIVYWYGSVNSSTGPAAFQLDATGSMLYPYLKADLSSFLDCPALKSTDIGGEQYTYPQTGHMLSYGIPSEMVASGTYDHVTATNVPAAIPAGIQLSMITSSSDTILAADSIAFVQGKLFRKPVITEPRIANYAPITMSILDVHGRHAHLANVLWFDGHVTSERPSYPVATVNGFDPRKYDVGVLAAPGRVATSIDANYWFWLNKNTKALNTVPIW